jgi:MoxR-like ATPase
VEVVTQTTSRRPEPIKAIFTGDDVQGFHSLVRKVPIAEDVVRYAVRLAAASRPRQANTPGFIKDWVNWGAGLRAGQNLVLGAKARALLQGRSHATIQDIQALAAPVLRHRILLNYKAEAEGITVDSHIGRLQEAANNPAKPAKVAA